ncbi:tannase/feruloyl esterase family alpha/beta hydrolase [Terriglobus sp. ADX1]|uniref:tannase/feruloyl esterase family alpha/beta hydrolase n=1 Tax=Terriglobus sp. ADX1 TaxID=2794063 RepID=UPI002FE63E3D
MIRSSLLALSLISLPASAFAAQNCAALKRVAVPDATILSATEVPSQPFATPVSGPGLMLPPLCVVKGILHPTADSKIRFEVWLPQTGWNGKIVDVGNGGFAGSIGNQQMGANVLQGYATADSDAGHQADSEDASWAFGHPEKIKDFGWRAVHLTAGVSKIMVKAYYGKPQEKAYFDSCSDGGREALMEAQRFPQDYDGILAGAPANNWTHMLANGLAMMQAMGSDPTTFFSSMKLPAIHAASLAACDAQDGLKDGILSDPEHCRFNPAVLTCKGSEDISCLTPKQVETLRTLYGGSKDAKGHIIFPGYVPGDEGGGWKSWILGTAPTTGSGGAYVANYFRYMVYNDPKWNPLAANTNDALRRGMEGPAKDIDATNPDLSAFAAHGGKLILYHGWNDPGISPWNTVNYFNEVKKTMGEAKADQTVRLFMAPGVEHCLGGPGPSLFGQVGFPAANGKGSGALDLLQVWVEKGTAPEMILAVTPKDPRVPQTMRPLCAYPKRAIYDGKGDPKQPTSFTCKAE